MNANANKDQMKNYTLDKSKGSQTAILPKSTYKELQTQPRLVKMTVYLHLHDKYKTFKVLIKIPDEYKDYPLGGGGQLYEYKWANHLPLPEMIGEWKPKETNIVEYNWDTYYLDEDEYYYAIFGATIVKNKKYKREKVTPPVEEAAPRKAPRQRRPKPIAETPALAQEKADPKIELNRKMEEIQTQLEEIQGQKAEAEKAYITACLQHAEARKAVEETLVLQRDATTKRAELLQKDGKIKTELENVKKELEKKELEKKENNRGYIVLAHDDYGGKEEMYGYAQTYRAAKTIANEAVKTGKCRKNINGLKYDDDCIVGEKVEALWNGDGKWYSATITKVYTTKKYDVEWDDHTTSCYLHEKKIKKLTKYTRFNSARIVDLDTQAEVEEFGQYIDGANVEDFGQYIDEEASW
jgi:hypothetical protein